MSSNTNVVGRTTGRTNLKTMVQIGMLGAISVVLMMFEIPLWFAPSFYQIDLSEVPVLIGAFALGPLAGAVIELVKILLHFIMKGSSTAGVGDLANFLIGCALIVPAGLVYKKVRSRKGALIGMILGIITMTAIGSLMNVFILLPVYAKAFGMPMDALVGMGSALNPAIDNIASFALFMVVPFNLLKGIIVSAITFLLYRYISPIFKKN
ncbi:ECF transporter S component [Robinsoniella peoriensis]|uniref:ECF transporter S component n=1 Tax=Robinsoniella peoriensis TaxID=180332 RepID=UPI00085CD4A0|nr:ECF transporter S component [Robinsoniella peoriensis]